MLAGGIAAGAAVGAAAGLLYGAVRHSPLVERPRPELENRSDHAILQEMQAESPQRAPARTDHAAGLRPRGTLSHVEEELQRRRATATPGRG